jgi:uracil-DNA glycosylase
LSSEVKPRWFDACQPFLKWTIEESAAPTVIALGHYAYEAVARAYGVTPPPFREVIEIGSPIQLDEHRILFAVFHPAAWPTNRTASQKIADWKRIADYRNHDTTHH